MDIKDLRKEMAEYWATPIKERDRKKFVDEQRARIRQTLADLEDRAETA
jgi:hypothetical protein